MVSVAAHVTLIAAAVYGTKGIAAAAAEPSPPIAIYLHREPAPATPALPRPTSAATSRGTPSGPAAPRLPQLPLPPAVEGRHFALGPVDLDLPTVASVSEEFQRGAALGAGPSARPGGAAGGPGGIFVEHQVDRAVAPLPGVVPRYPAALRAGGVEGRVRARFVVDTLGRVELATVEFPSASHPQFAEAVRQALPRLRFRPAEAGGRRVRQLVEQEFAFALRQ